MHEVEDSVAYCFNNVFITFCTCWLAKTIRPNQRYHNDGRSKIIWAREVSLGIRSFGLGLLFCSVTKT